MAYRSGLKHRKAFIFIFSKADLRALNIDIRQVVFDIIPGKVGVDDRIYILRYRLVGFFLGKGTF
jgi:hypothetical protein